ncbi:MAG: DUF4835 family protein [Bacteroidota bacterium]
MLFLPHHLSSQELNCNVIVNAERAETQDRAVFTDMEISFEEFLNNRRWTDDTYEVDERINCNLLITIDDQTSIGNFEATVQIQSARPIFNTNYESILLNYADRDWQFEYFEAQPLIYNDNSFGTNLVSMLAYYAYIILGLDYDSFQKQGGTPYFERAWNIVQNSQQSSRPGWQQFESNRNRYWLAQNILGPQFREIRNIYYDYHRLAMDQFEENSDESRKTILESLKKVQEINNSRPNSIGVISFFDAKSNELANLFSEGDITTRRQAYDILVEIDPTNTDRYKKIIAN